MDLDERACYQALLTRDARFDGRFFTGVTTTGVYCRPICPARTPRRRNVRFFPCAAAAEAAGFRACRRCRPEASPGTPAWAGSSAVVQRALRLIDAGALDEDSVDTLADRLGIGSRQLRRLFDVHLGASPVHVAVARRVHFAKSLLHETDLPVTDIALAVGFGSVRQFNDAFRQTFACAPRDVRRLAGSTDPAPQSAITLRLSYRPPFDWSRTLAFLRRRATPGVEHVTDTGYQRVVRVGGVTAVLEVRHAPADNAVLVSIDPPPRTDLVTVVSRVRRMFDLAADPVRIDAHLSRSPVLKRLVRRAPGIRVPGAWDPFELAVRAIVGQQISVAAATTVMGRVVRLCGAAAPNPTATLGYCFPAPQDVASADLRAAGLTEARAGTLRRVAAAVAERNLALDTTSGLDDFVRRCCTFSGIGAWTAQYIAMRGLGEPDAFPDGDLGLQTAAGNGERLTAKELARVAESWRPWRAYAAMYLWSS